MIHRLHHFHFVLRISRQNDLERAQHSHATLGSITEILAHTILEYAHLNELVFLGYSRPCNKIAQRSSWIAAPAHAGNRRHAWVVPTRNDSFFNK